MGIFDRINPTSSQPLTGAIFTRLLALIYVISFASFLPQLSGLIGSRGIVPAAQWLESIRAQGVRAYIEVPTLFWLHISDSFLKGACICGCLAALIMASGWFMRTAAFVCWILYLSIVSVGQPFSNFQWDALLLECGFLAMFVGLPITGYAYRFLLFRLMFESGLVKLISGDATWHNLTALRHHFSTQPLPNPLAYYAQWLPDRLLDAMTLATLVIEVAMPFLLFGTRHLRLIATGSFMMLQVLILLTGNYAFFNLLTLALCFWGLDDNTFEPLRQILRPSSLSIKRQLPRQMAAVLVSVLVALAAIGLIGMVVPPVARATQAVLPWIESFDLVNQYGLFAVMTTSRTELVIEGSYDGINWREYQFRYKPGQPNRYLPVVAPYQPRLDWQMWFAALGSYEQNSWVGGLVYRLLSGEPSVTALLGSSPFAKPPVWIRILAYDYSFAKPQVRSRTGAVWERKLLGIWLNPVSLRR